MSISVKGRLPLFCIGRKASTTFALGFIINDISKSSMYPRPEHSGHIPCGALKENSLGSSSGAEIPCTGQLLLEE